MGVLHLGTHTTYQLRAVTSLELKWGLLFLDINMVRLVSFCYKIKAQTILQKEKKTCMQNIKQKKYIFISIKLPKETGHANVAVKPFGSNTIIL